MRLFTALWPPDDVAAALDEHLRASPPWHPDGGWRLVPPRNRHITLCFHGDDDPAVRAGILDRDLAGAAAPALRLGGPGTFPGVLRLAVRSAPAVPGTPDRRTADPGPAHAHALCELAARTGADPSSFHPHLTLARRSARADRERPALRDGAAEDPVGPWWTPAEALLVRSDLTPDGPVYTPVHRVPLVVPPPAGTAVPTGP
ncbi:2'-5' RNA ligase family protein [Pseudonocardia phyllosphaerae]|uniref:2'-5' RNA ligase family protein n=1 Tax=Pseudonocardia phyllosphaerae TaxID=3390502 RepID=UPI00397AAD4F